MPKFSPYRAGLSALVLLASLTGGMSVSAALRLSPKVPVPQPRISLPQQQQSVWGINQNLQHDRDRWQWQHQKAPQPTGTTKYLEQ